MKPPEGSEVAAWIEKAAEDEQAIDVLLEHSPWLLSVIGFHAQQAAEKWLKALLVACGEDAPRTHDLVALLERTMSDLDDDATVLLDAQWLTGFGVLPRYPGAPVPIRDPEATSREAVARLRRIVDAVRARMPST